VTREEIQELVGIISTAIEAGLVRDGIARGGIPVLRGTTAAGVSMEWTPTAFAEERARNIVQALLGEFEMKRLPPAEPCGHVRQRIELFHGEFSSYCLDCGKVINE
jgi:hypothetical protein